MRKPRKDAQETRQRLLAAAAEVFAQKGYWEATHAEICQKAQANIAAVNYHFGSKEKLYIEAWRHAFERSIQAYPPDGGVRPDATAPERLRGHILALMRRMSDPENREIEIVHKEMANPTGLLGEAIEGMMEPMRRDLYGIIRELVGSDADEEQSHFCEISVIGQCFGPMLHLRARKAGMPVPAGRPQITVEHLADHITRFSLAGIQEIRERAEKFGKNDKPRRSGGRPAKPRRS